MAEFPKAALYLHIALDISHPPYLPKLDTAVQYSLPTVYAESTEYLVISHQK